jgi:hypothetical protein
MGRVRALPPAREDPAVLLTTFQQLVQENLFQTPLDQACPKFAQDGIMKPAVSEVQA